MNAYNIYDLFFENVKKFFYFEDWLEFDVNFSKSQLFTMMLVDRHGELMMSKIAEYFNLPMSTTSGMVERLVKRGYLKRERSELDRRIVVIKLTDEGKAVVDRLKEKIFYYIDKISDSITEEEMQVLSGIFYKILNALNDIGKEKNITDSQTESKKVKKIEIE